MNERTPVEDTRSRDRLAGERTRLASERTLLAYARTGLAFLVAGVSGVHLLDPSFWKAIAWIFIFLGPVVLGFGIWRFARFRRAHR